ncbi:glycosyltransferase family 4 protein [Segetibacter aerophilus]|uniref:Glycosyl transferase n=1 Tax=Segetibacter aerophilus TaxID=670293 RepID=A0A512B6M0_9BACT|nr:glycosyltransferase family 4 protein [Segetibacter aerophilus]GEO07612.1 glycosyl transferase [Segetibacter aerophilus]
MKIAYVTTYNALDIHKWSGLGYYIAKSIEDQSNEIEYIGNLNAKPNLSLRLKSKLYEKLGKNFALEREPYIAKQYARQAERLVKKSNIFFSPGTIPTAFLQSNKPKVLYTDATFAGLIDFYPEFSNFSRETIKHGNEIEQAALSSSAMVIFSSNWAATTAIESYNVNPDKLKVVPFGANVEHNYAYEDIKAIVRQRSTDECNILFSGVDWKRKGGQFAIEVAKKLNQLGLSTKLHLLGLTSIPDYSILPDFVINHGFVSKSTEEGKKQINRIITNSHFLILPTNSDASPLALSEANSFGTPCVCSNVGGITTIIKDYINGKTFPLSATVDDYATYIYEAFKDNLRYQELALGSFNEYKVRLNWNVAGAEINKLLKALN